MVAAKSSGLYTSEGRQKLLVNLGLLVVVSVACFLISCSIGKKKSNVPEKDDRETSD